MQTCIGMFWSHREGSFQKPLPKLASEERIVMAGLSGGGWTTTVAAAVDPRIVPWFLCFCLVHAKAPNQYGNLGFGRISFNHGPWLLVPQPAKELSMPIAGSIPCDFRRGAAARNLVCLTMGVQLYRGVQTVGRHTSWDFEQYCGDRWASIGGLVEPSVASVVLGRAKPCVLMRAVCPDCHCLSWFSRSWLIDWIHVDSIMFHPWPWPFSWGVPAQPSEATTRHCMSWLPWKKIEQAPQTNLFEPVNWVNETRWNKQL